MPEVCASSCLAVKSPFDFCGKPGKYVKIEDTVRSFKEICEGKYDDIVVCGIQYPNCIRATIFDGVALGYKVTLVTDATGAQTDEIAKANIFDIGNIGVKCISTTQFIKT